MPELVGKVEEDEKIELMELVEKKSALENLKLLDLNKEKYLKKKVITNRITNQKNTFGRAKEAIKIGRYLFPLEKFF